MGFSDVVSNVHTGQSGGVCDMADPPKWLSELEERVEDEIGQYDRFTSLFLAQSIKRIDAYLQNEIPVRMPPMRPMGCNDGRLEKWFNNRDRSEYMQKGKYGYYDRLEMERESGVKKAKQVGAQIEYREVFEAVYNFLVDNDIIEVVEPEKERSHSALTDDEGWVDLRAVQQGEKDGAIYDALAQLHDTYTDGECVHERKPAQLTDPEVAPDQERTALNLEIAFNLSLLSMGEEADNFQHNFQCQEDSGKILIDGFAEASRPDTSIVFESGEGCIAGEITGLATDRELRENELPEIADHAERFADEQDVPEEELIIYFVTALSLNEDSTTWRKSFQTHHEYGPSIVPNDIEGHADLFAHFKQLDGHSLDQFETFLKGISFSAENHDILRDAPNTIEWLNQTVDEAYRQVNEGEIEDIRDIDVTISTRHDDEQVNWPLIADGETLQDLVGEMNDLDELMGTGNRPFELDEDLKWDEAVDELYDQIKDFYYGVSDLLGHEKRDLQSIKEGLKLPFVMGELRKLKEEWHKRVGNKFTTIIQQFNKLTNIHNDFEAITNNQRHKELYEQFNESAMNLPMFLSHSDLISMDQERDLRSRIKTKPNIKEILAFIDACLEKAGVENYEEIRSMQRKGNNLEELE